MLTNAILSWHSTLTLINTLESYKYYGLDKLAGQKVIFFQEITREDKKIAKDFGYDYIGDPNNIGIAAAYKRLIDYSMGDLFLFLENDWELIRDPIWIMNDAMGMLSTGWTDVVKLRSRLNPGEPLWSRQYAGKERDHPTFMLDAVHWREDGMMVDLEPEILPRYSTFSKVHWYMTDARHANWTNNPTMFRTDWLRATILPHLAGDIESAVQPWWESQDTIRVTQGEGLFTHRRLDR